MCARSFRWAEGPPMVAGQSLPCTRGMQCYAPGAAALAPVSFVSSRSSESMPPIA